MTKGKLRKHTSMKRLSLLFLVLFLLLAGCQQSAPTPTPTPPPNLQVNFIDVGQGDAILLRTPEGNTMLIDGGEKDPGVMAYLKGQGVSRIDVLVATHPHSDHIGGLIAVLRQLDVKEVWTNGQPHTSSLFEDFLLAIQASKASYHEAQRGQTIALGTLKFQVLHPAARLLEDINNNSIVLRLEWGKFSLLFTGDAGKEAEADMLAAGQNVRAQILKVGHHGSSGASSAAFLKAVAPEVAVYSAGRGNSYGHPSPQTVQRLQAQGVRVYGTDVNGTITVTGDGQSYRVTTER